MLTFCRHSNLSSGSALPAASGPAEAVVKLLRMLPPLPPLLRIGTSCGSRAGWSIQHRSGDRPGRSDSDTIFMLDFLHDERTLYRTDVLVPSEHIQQELLVGVHVGSLYSEQVVETTGDVVAFGHFGNPLHHLGE